MSDFVKGDLWFVSFPYEDDPSTVSNRPVIVLDENTLGVLSVKVTKHPVRTNDEYDTPILYWTQAGLRFSSTARVSKVQNLKPDDFIFKLGSLHPDDLANVEASYVKYMKDRASMTE